MLDCSFGVGGRGCNGGSNLRYTKWMHKNHNGGLANEAEYPYRAATAGTSQCQNSTIAIANHGALVEWDRTAHFMGLDDKHVPGDQPSGGILCDRGGHHASVG